MSQQVVSGTLAAAVADSGTFTVSYPTGMSRGNFSLGINAKLLIRGQVLSQPADIGLSYGATSVTVTNRTGAAWPQGATFRFQFDMPGNINPVYVSGVESYTPLNFVRLNLGSPITADVDGICESQAKLAAGALTLNGALVSGGVAYLGCTGRGIVIDNDSASDTTQTVTVTGTDLYGNAMKETIAFNGTTAVQGVKAFFTVTGITVSAALVGNAFIGTNDVLGIPVRLPNAVNIIKELMDGAAPSAGTVVAGLALDTESTATSADVRGTYDPNSACNGSLAFALFCALADPQFLGQPQYSG